jgi:UPF0716 family protein affecting phage T7 exclusion
MLDFIQMHQDFFYWLGAISAFLFVVTLLLTPYLLGLMPQDYFIGKAQVSSDGILLKIAKNVLGGVLVLAGIIMLFTPGQGVVAILLGLFLMDFPKKRQLEHQLIKNEPTFKTLNWLRSKASKPKFKR